MDVDQNHTTWLLPLYVCNHDLGIRFVRSNQGFVLYHNTGNFFYRECDLHPLTPLEKEMVVKMMGKLEWCDGKLILVNQKETVTQIATETIILGKPIYKN